jgi:hypothetical protein
MVGQQSNPNLGRVNEAERVSVDFGLTWTLSDAFEVLGCDLPQHLPHHQFSSVNSTEAVNRLQHMRFR